MDEFEQDREQASRIGLIIGIIICFILIVSASFGLIFIKHEKRQFINETSNVKTNINDEQDTIEMQLTTISNLKEQINENSNIDNLINKLKESYYENAKKLEQSIIHDKSDAKIAYLTFDDGPYLLTNSYLDVLDEKDVRATFFCLEKDEKYGFDEENIEEYDKIYKRIINEGHTLGNHSSSYSLDKDEDNYIYKDVDSFMNAIIENRDFIYNRYGYTTQIMRFPGGSSQAKDLKTDIVEALNKEKYGYVDWNSATGDGEEIISAEQSTYNIVETSNDQKILVILMHDYSENTLEALPNIIDGLRDKGYTLLPLFYESAMVHKK